MVYRRNNKSNNDLKIIGATVVTFCILLSLTFYIFKELFLNQNNDSRYNTLLYTQVLNSSMPVVKVTSFEEEALAEDNITIKGEILKLIGVNMYNPISILGREISFLNSAEYGYDKGESQPLQQPQVEKQPLPEKVAKGGAFNIEDFQLDDEEIIPDNPGTNQGGSEKSPNNIPTTNLPNQLVNVYNPNIKKTINHEKPEILIYHTHTSESFAPNGNYNRDPEKNICDVGDDLTYELENNYGISVIHDKTIHDSVFNNSYYRSRETVEKYMKKYGDFKLVIDMHRDGLYSKNGVTTKMNGENVSKMMFVLTKKNPHFSKNYNVASDLKAISDKIFPGFCRDLYYYNFGTKYFNQDKSNNAILIEVGANVNTHQESKNSAQYMARVIAEYLNDRK